MTFWQGRRLVFHHGTTVSRAIRIAVNGPDLNLSRRALDFGRGFYTTTRLYKAIQWSLMAASRHADRPALVTFATTYEIFSTWQCISFADAGLSAEEFWEFVRQNRTSRQAHRPLPSGYFDVVIGPVSQDFRRRVPIDDIDQISFHTDLALRQLGAQSSIQASAVHLRISATRAAGD